MGTIGKHSDNRMQPRSKNLHHDLALGRNRLREFLKARSFSECVYNSGFHHFILSFFIRTTTERDVVSLALLEGCASGISGGEALLARPLAWTYSRVPPLA